MDDPMKIDALQVRALRQARAWSQEHLAAVSGISLRTIQRVESEGSASFETRMALGAALGVSAESLLPTSPKPYTDEAPAAFSEAGLPLPGPSLTLTVGITQGILWASAIIAAASFGASSILSTLVLPGLALLSILAMSRPHRKKYCWM